MKQSAVQRKATARGATSTLRLGRPGLDIRIVVYSQFTKRLRRQVLLALFRSAKEVLQDLEGRDLFHSDSGFLSLSASLGRPVSLHQALSVTTRARSEGLDIRLRRLAFRLTQAQFSVLAGISRPHLSRIEHGKVELEALTRAKIGQGFRVARSRYQKLQFATRENGEERGTFLSLNGSQSGSEPGEGRIET